MIKRKLGINIFARKEAEGSEGLLIHALNFGLKLINKRKVYILKIEISRYK